jgi:hypothetical protein
MIDLIGFIGTTEVMPCYKTVEDRLIYQRRFEEA